MVGGAGPRRPNPVILDGAALAKRIRARARDAADAISRASGPPSLRVLLVGENPASEAYVASKAKAAAEAGIRAETLRLPVDISPDALLAEVARANADPDVRRHPRAACRCRRRATTRRASSTRCTRLKDVDGLHPENVGLLHQGRPRFVPCTPAGIMELLAAYEIPIEGRAGRRARPQRHRRQADGAAAHGARRDRDGVPLEDARPRRGVPRRPISSWPPSAGPGS